MHLTLNELRACAAGCAEVRAEPEGVFFDRMTPALRTLYATSEAAIIRARCQAGVRLRFSSDTRTLRLVLRFGRAARPLFCADLFVDAAGRGTFTGQARGQPCPLELFASAESSRRAFELWLPYAVESWVVSLAVDDGATVTPLPPEPATWLAIGDSITQGMTCASPARTYAGLAARALGISHHNTAVGGARMEPGAGQVAGIEATFATAAFGCNDWNGGKPLAQFAADTAAFLETLFAARPGLPLGLITPFPAVGDRGERNAAAVDLEAYRDVVRRQAAAHPSVRLIEGPSLIPAEAAFFADGIHPNDAGMAVIAERLAPHLRTLQAAARPAA